MELTVWVRAGGSAWGKGGARGDTAASQPHHSGAPVTSGSLQALGDFLPCSKSQDKSQGAQLGCLLRPIPHIPHWMILALLVVPFYCF